MTLAIQLPQAGFRRYGSLLSPMAWGALAVAAAVVLLSLFAPVLAPYDPDYVDLNNVLAGPSGQHLLGTDALGRDLLSRLMHGGRTSLLGPTIVVIGSTVLGLLLGLVAGWSEGWLGKVLGRLFDLLFAFPALLMAMLAIALFGKGLFAPILAMTIAYVPYVARLAQSLVVAERSRPYVQAYRVLGFRTPWVVLGRVLPNLIPTVGAQSTLNFGYVLADLAALSFIGLGVQPPTSDWGAMIEESRGALLGGYILPAFWPALVVVLVVVAVNVIGEELSDRIGGKLS
ncbi:MULTISPECIES: ABC transporter permease [Micrococcaceae]|jgi:peptide/nickel transport system permease protein|uniref:ABC-type dipeptide/oligopeptide/nickel transport systems, permease components n=1 Tax=Paenarthrobacter aurescens (strain TC1) TaxID=290340 RepID=A1R301_PAEAT|nr:MULTISPECIES: ABC transporter permease [Micrococcaceae]ABM07442.1 putative ABC-type dipeptide/oligopeptide/nickel transport systems, permease components [Paenarthrobacter aurescens TC1]AFR27697.1 glutathione transport system permease protein GsiD [Arthrobacter sp. Rue61a]MBP2267400.1 peptide/nickel transport system permease protein [Pseudarthrobacter sp. PvP004]